MLDLAYWFIAVWILGAGPLGVLLGMFIANQDREDQ